MNMSYRYHVLRIDMPCEDVVTTPWHSACKAELLIDMDARAELFLFSKAFKTENDDEPLLL